MTFVIAIYGPIHKPVQKIYPKVCLCQELGNLHPGDRYSLKMSFTWFAPLYCVCIITAL